MRFSVLIFFDKKKNEKNSATQNALFYSYEFRSQKLRNKSLRPTDSKTRGTDGYRVPARKKIWEPMGTGKIFAYADPCLKLLFDFESIKNLSSYYTVL